VRKSIPIWPPITIGFAGRDVNLYGYTFNRPTVYIDPSGLATYSSAEGHFILGGGLLEIECCTEDGKGFKHLYIKGCLGAAFEASGGGGIVSNSDGQACSNPPKNMLGGELSVSIGPGGADLAATVDTAGGCDPSVSSGPQVAVGIPVKATACYYRLIQSIPSDNDCGCPSGE